ncbi:MAG: hypothetical protein ABSA47_05455 [Verrucomicrobiota bacterium]|jgi:hypothetical protein
MNKRSTATPIFGNSLAAATAALLLSAAAAFAQTAQPLEYRTGVENLSYHQIQLTTNPPPGVLLPKLKAMPWFARWTTPLDPSGGRWLCLDRTHNSGPYDLLFIDTNGNGRLDDKTPVHARMDAFESSFPPTPVVLQGQDGPLTYHLVFLMTQFDAGSAQLLVSPGGWREGVVSFDGLNKRIQLIDANVNGAFNDISSDPYQSDRVCVEGDKIPERFLGRMIEVDGKFYRIEVPRDGAFVKVQPVGQGSLAQVRVPENISEISLYGQNGHFVCSPLNGLLTLPAGDYRPIQWIINRKDDKGASWTMRGYNFPDTFAFDVSAGKTNALEIGEPAQALIAVREIPGAMDIFSLHFEGRQKEAIEILRQGQRPPGPKLTIAGPDGAVCYSDTFEYG